MPKQQVLKDSKVRHQIAHATGKNPTLLEAAVSITTRGRITAHGTVLHGDGSTEIISQELDDEQKEMLSLLLLQIFLDVDLS